MLMNKQRQTVHRPAHKEPGRTGDNASGATEDNTAPNTEERREFTSVPGHSTVTKASSVRDPGVMPAESKAASLGSFRIAPTPEKKNQRSVPRLKCRTILHKTTENSSDPPNQMTSGLLTRIHLDFSSYRNAPHNPSTCTGRCTNTSRKNHQPLQDPTPRDDGATFQTTHQRVQHTAANLTRTIHQRHRDLTPRDDGAIFQPAINVCRTQGPPLMENRQPLHNLTSRDNGASNHE